MYGRNGFDRFWLGLLWKAVALSVLNIFIRTPIIWILEDIAIIYCIFRVLSKNIYKRQRENQVFMSVWGKVKGFFKLQKNRFRDRKTHVYRVCPHCKINLRLPKRKGTHTVKCPKCGLRFEVRG